ncbi:diphthine--ammonia ligase [Bacillus sp. Bva_UNVM-123]|uniref:Dph6-related ATP pyrophosphatase n=1 Tax=Bacillus sp. Bva_UNVM-123 TaxID=2829798 RepID=UPI00391F3F9C
MRKRVALSWSGGKDGCLALDVLTNQEVDVVCLVTTVPQEIGRTFGHSEKIEMVKLQSDALGIPIELISCTYESYTSMFINILTKLKEIYKLEGIAFGDLYLDGHRKWGEELAKQVDLEAIYPLWTKQENSLKALEVFINSGYKAKVIKVREDVLDETWLGKTIDMAFMNDVRKIEMCPMGESGEYHTFVYDGPLFKSKIVLEQPTIIELESTKKLEFHQYELMLKD